MQCSLALKPVLLILLVYSDVREIEESGDLVGTELVLQVTGEAVTGTLRHYEGTEPEPIAMTGSLANNTLTLSGSYAEGKVQIAARLQKDRVIGKLSYHLGGQTNDVELNLPRIERARMQKAGTAPAKYDLSQVSFTESFRRLGQRRRN